MPTSNYGPSQQARGIPPMRDNTVRRPSLDGMQVTNNTLSASNHPSGPSNTPGMVSSASPQPNPQSNYLLGNSIESATLPRNFKAAPTTTHPHNKSNTSSRPNYAYESSTLPRNFSFEKQNSIDNSNNYPIQQPVLNSPRNVNYSINKAVSYDRSLQVRNKYTFLKYKCYYYVYITIY